MYVANEMSIIILASCKICNFTIKQLNCTIIVIVYVMAVKIRGEIERSVSIEGAGQRGTDLKSERGNLNVNDGQFFLSLPSHLLYLFYSTR